jgi:Cytochrome c554 and c-prime
MTAEYRKSRQPWLAAAVCVALAGAARGAPPQPAIVTCANCHRAEAQSQPETAMGIGIELPPNQKPLQAHPKLTVEENGYRYNIERKNGVSTYTVSDGSGALSLPIRYAFGVDNLTFVLEYQGRFYESLVSYYQKIEGLGITMGDERMRPHDLTEAMGRKTSDQEITSCFNCHGTGGVSQGKLTLASLKPGLSCEHCHTGADAHMQAMAGGKPAPAPLKLGEMAAEEMSNFCGQCHRTWESVVGLRLFGEKNVRFQPYRLANSQCFLGDDKRIRCTACHDPHAALVRQEASYDRACLSCHSVTQKTCPVADKNCISCHMPKVQVPGSPALFTDHEIRVVHAGDPYPQ